MQYMFNFLKKLCEKENKNVDQHIVGYKTRQTITLIKKLAQFLELRSVDLWAVL